MASESKKIYILHDFDLALKLYNLKPNYKKKITQSLDNKVVFISTNNKKLLIKNYKKISVFWGNRLNKDLLNNLVNLKWVHFGSSGINFELKEELIKKKIQITRSNKILSEPVVASIFSFIFFLGRGLMPTIKKNIMIEKILKIIMIIYQVSSMIKLSFLVKEKLQKKLKKKLLSIGSKVSIVKEKNKIRVLENKNNLKSIQSSKFVINCLPFSKQNINFFDKGIFKHLKNCYFINIGRGETVNQNDLIYYLNKNHLIGAALDVFHRKDYVSPYRPLNYKSELWKNKKILITPHISARNKNYWKLQSELFIKLLKKKQKKIIFANPQLIYQHKIYLDHNLKNIL